MRLLNNVRGQKWAQNFGKKVSSNCSDALNFYLIAPVTKGHRRFKNGRRIFMIEKLHILSNSFVPFPNIFHGTFRSQLIMST